MSDNRELVDKLFDDWHIPEMTVRCHPNEIPRECRLEELCLKISGRLEREIRYSQSTEGAQFIVDSVMHSTHRLIRDKDHDIEEQVYWDCGVEGIADEPYTGWVLRQAVRPGKHQLIALGQKVRIWSEE